MPIANQVRANASRTCENFLVLILFLTWGTVFLDRMSQLYLAPYFAPEFRLNSEQIGFLASVTAIAWALSGFFFGALSDRYGRRPVLVPAIFLFSALSWMSGMVHSFTQLLIVRALLGVAEGPCWAIITAIIEESSPPTAAGAMWGSSSVPRRWSDFQRLQFCPPRWRHDSDGDGLSLWRAFPGS